MTTIEIFEKAVTDCIAHCSFFPKPTELYEYVKFHAEKKYVELQKIETDHQLEWMEPTEEGKAIAKQYLGRIFDVIEKEIIKPKLQREQQQAFEEKRKIAKEKAKGLR